MEDRWGLTLLALVVAPLAGATTSSVPVVALLWLLDPDLAQQSRDLPLPLHFLGQVAFMSVVGSVVGLLATFTLGLPWHLVAQWRQWRRAHGYVLAGCVCGLALGLPVMLATNQTGAFAGFVFVAWGAAAGAVSGLTGWLIRRPDRDPGKSAIRTP